MFSLLLDLIERIKIFLKTSSFQTKLFIFFLLVSIPGLPLTLIAIRRQNDNRSKAYLPLTPPITWWNPITWLDPTPTPYSFPTGTPRNAYVSFKFSFYGLPQNPQCAANWKLKLIAKRGNFERVYSEITPIKDPTVLDEAVYRVEKLRLDGFPYTYGVSLFLKGMPKHIQVKYAENNQNSFYRNQGGQLLLSTDPNRVPVYDFTNYPMLAGDVTGMHGYQDGVVDGLDFALVKSSISDVISPPGSEVPGDLDGSCKTNALDLVILLHSLTQVYDLTY